MFILQLGFIGAAIAFVPLAWIWLRSGADKFGKLVWVTAFLTLDLVLFGSFTRLADAGLGCPDWPGCYGTASPLHAHQDIRAAQVLWPDGPVTLMKAWIEMTHRYLALALGALLIIITWIAWLERRQRRTSLAWPFVLLALIGVQGAFGAWTVTLKLQPLIVTLHLLLGLMLFGALVCFATACTPSTDRIPLEAQRWRWIARIGLVLLAVQIALGGWVSTNYATLACPDFPTCLGAWLPQMDFKHGFQLWRALGGTARGTYLMHDARVAIHWMHRTFAWIVIAYFVWLGLALRRFQALRPKANGLILALMAQFATGVSTIALKSPLMMAWLHSAGSAMLLLLMVMLNVQFTPTHATRALASSTSSSNQIK